MATNIVFSLVIIVKNANNDVALSLYAKSASTN